MSSQRCPKAPRSLPTPGASLFPKIKSWEQHLTRKGGSPQRNRCPPPPEADPTPWRELKEKEWHRRPGPDNAIHVWKPRGAGCTSTRHERGDVCMPGGKAAPAPAPPQNSHVPTIPACWGMWGCAECPSCLPPWNAAASLPPEGGGSAWSTGKENLGLAAD